MYPHGAQDALGDVIEQFNESFLIPAGKDLRYLSCTALGVEIWPNATLHMLGLSCIEIHVQEINHTGHGLSKAQIFKLRELEECMQTHPVQLSDSLTARGVDSARQMARYTPGENMRLRPCVYV